MDFFQLKVKHITLEGQVISQGDRYTSRGIIMYPDSNAYEDVLMPAGQPFESREQAQADLIARVKRYIA